MIIIIKCTDCGWINRMKLRDLEKGVEVGIGCEKCQFCMFQLAQPKTEEANSQ